MDFPGNAADGQCRYLEAAVNGVLVASIFAPNGNPQPGPKFDYKLAWLERLNDYAGKRYAAGAPVVLAGDFNVVPTDFDIYPTKSWGLTHFCSPRAALCINAFSRRAGPIPFASFIPKSRCTPSGITSGSAGNAMTVCVSSTSF
jgi:exonuclease III